jgi:hypothetical protein
MGGNAAISDRANINAKRTAGKELTTKDIRVAERGFTSCIPIQAKTAELPKPRLANRTRPTATTSYLGPQLSIID